MERVLYDDQYGTDLLIDELHNVNLDCAHDMLSSVTHESRDGKPMEVQFHPTLHTYLIMVGE